MLTAARPDTTLQLARSFEEAGRTAHEAYQRGRQAHGTIAEASSNNGAPVLDADAQSATVHRLLGQGGQDLEDTAGFLKRSVSALDGALTSSNTAITGMQTQLRALLDRWNRFVLANAVNGGVTPADRERAVAEGVGIVTAAAGRVREAVDGYDAVLLRDAGELAARGYTADQQTLAAHLAGVPDTTDPAAEAGAPGAERKREIFEALGIPLGVLGALTAGMAGKKALTLLQKSGQLARYQRYATAPGATAFEQRFNQQMAARTLQQFRTGFPKAGAHLQRGALGTAMRGLGNSRAAQLAGKAFLPLTVVTGGVDAFTGGGYGGVRGGITRGLGAAGAIGATALMFTPVGATAAGAAVLAYGAWKVGNLVYDHRAEIAEGFNAAKDWAGRTLSGIGDSVADSGKKVLSSVSFGLLG